MEAISHDVKLSSNSFLALLSITILVITIIIIIQTLKLRTSSKPTKTTTVPPPGPWRLPIIGNLHQLATNGGRSQPHRRLAQLARRYGPDVMHLQLGELSHVIISTPEAARLVMKTHDLTFASRPPLLGPYVIFGGGYNDIACAPYGEHWRQMRKICTLEFFSAKRVGSYRWVREEEVANLVATLRRQVTSLPNDDNVVVDVDLGKELNKLSGSITSRVVFGQSRGVNEALLELVDDFTDANGGFRISDLYPSLTFLPALTGFEAMLKKVHEKANSVLTPIIDERRSSRKSSSSSGGDHEAEEDSLIDVLLNLQENPDQMGFTLTKEVIKAVTLELMFGGIDTSSKVTEWTMSELMKHPGVMQTAQQEVREAFREKGNVDEAGLHQLKYLDCVIKEGLRLHPPVPLLLPREKNGEEVELCGYTIEEKTKVLVNAWAINRDPRYWPDAEKFDPERFIDCSTNYRGKDFQFIPFGAGRRMCPGYEFGLKIVKLTLANLLLHFRWELPGNMKPEDLDMTECITVVAGRKNPLMLIPLPYP